MLKVVKTECCVIMSIPGLILLTLIVTLIYAPDTEVLMLNPLDRFC